MVDQLVNGKMKHLAITKAISAEYPVGENGNVIEGNSNTEAEEIFYSSADNRNKPKFTKQEL